MAQPDKTTVARAAMAAVEPFVELFLELGITSPEAESLLRSVYVHAARKWLAKRGGETEPSDVRVALATGVHRNFVRRILSEPPRIAAAREQKGHRAGRLLEAWHSDPKYLDSSGKPRDLSERDQEPSFHTLATTYVPGTAPGVVLGDLRRAGLVQMLAEHRVRVRGRSYRAQGVNAGNVADMGHRARELLQTMVHNLDQPQAPRFCESMPEIEVDVARAPFVRDLISRRAGNFLAAIEQELAAEASERRRRRSRQRVRIGLTAVATER
ncbi:MAG: DUF6502 family protein [Steroidobacteraceae bacterium]